MANPHLGEVPLNVDGEVYNISFSLNAMCELEEAFGQPLLAVIAELEEAQANPRKLRIATVRTLIWGALQDHHPEIDEKQAGLLAGRAGLPNVMAAILQAIQLAFPQANPGAKPKNPPKAKG